MESNLKKIGEKFYDLNVSITGMCCLGLLDSSNRNAARTLEEMLDTEDVDELNAIFGLGEGDLEEDDLDFSFILDLCHGWLVLAEVAQPRNISFNDAGEWKDTQRVATLDLSPHIKIRWKKPWPTSQLRQKTN